MLGQQSGFGLLEVLVSLIVLSVGLLGLAGLQATAMRFNHDAEMRSQVIVQAYAMADRMRANRTGVIDGNYDNLSGTPASTPSCTSCSPADTATRDLFEWNTANTNLLPAGQGVVTANGSNHTITIRWDNDRTGATGTNCSGNGTVDLMCLTISVQI